MGNKIYVGNLPFKIGDKELNKIFSEFGAITEAVVIKDKYSKRSKGFGFVTFESDESAENAIASMNGKEVEGRALKVSESKPREESDRSYWLADWKQDFLFFYFYNSSPLIKGTKAKPGYSFSIIFPFSFFMQKIDWLTGATKIPLSSNWWIKCEGIDSAEALMIILW